MPIKASTFYTIACDRCYNHVAIDGKVRPTSTWPPAVFRTAALAIVFAQSNHWRATPNNCICPHCFPPDTRN